MKEAWPVPETGGDPIDPEMASQVLSTVRSESHIRFTDGDSDSDDSDVVRELFAGKQSGDGVDMDELDDIRPVSGKKKWKQAVVAVEEEDIDWKKEMKKSAKKLMTEKSSKEKQGIISEIIAYQAMDNGEKSEKASDKK